MPRSMSTAAIAAKNAIHEIKSWLLLVQIDITGKYEIGYDGCTANFHLGSRLTGGENGAQARIIADSASVGGTTGTLTLYDVRGSFDDDEAITDNWSTIGSGVINGAASATAATYRYVRNLSAATWDTAGVGTTWAPRSIQLEVMGDSGQGKPAECVIKIDNTDSTDNLTNDLHICQGLRGEAVTMRYVYSGDATSTAIVTENFIIADHSGSGPYAELTLVPDESMFQRFPRRIYDSYRCPWVFKSTVGCQHTATMSSHTTCGRTLLECAVRANETNFGAFPGIMGQEFE